MAGLPSVVNDLEKAKVYKHVWHSLCDVEQTSTGMFVELTQMVIFGQFVWLLAPKVNRDKER